MTPPLDSGATGPVSSPIPYSERRRLDALYSTGLLDSAINPAFDVITLKAAVLSACPIAVVSLVDRHRQRFLSKVGLALDETPRSVSLCSHAILAAKDDVMVIPDARNDQRFTASRVVSAAPFARFYAGAPIIAQNDYPIGVLCVLDPSPRWTYSARQKNGLRALAAEAGVLADRAIASNSALAGKSRKMDVSLGRRLQWLRVKRGLLKGRLAFELNVSVQTLDRIELGELRASADQLFKLSVLLDVPIAYFFRGNLDDV